MSEQFFSSLEFNHGRAPGVRIHVFTALHAVAGIAVTIGWSKYEYMTPFHTWIAHMNVLQFLI